MSEAVRFEFVLPAEMLARLHRQAKEEERSAAAVIRRAITAHMDEQERLKAKELARKTG